MVSSCLNFAIFVILIIILSVFRSVNAQVTTACSSSVIKSFTPCVNYVTGSSGGTGSSPTEECCNSLKSLMSDNMDCVCLIVTGNVPVSIPFINANLAISLPRMCKSSVPLQCKASGVPLPAPGPVLFGPTRAPAAHAPTKLAPAVHAPTALAPAPHSHSPKASKAAAAAAPPPIPKEIAAASPPKFSLSPSANPGIRPVFNPKSASTPSAVVLPSSVLMFVGIIAFNFV